MAGWPNTRLHLMAVYQQVLLMRRVKLTAATGGRRTLGEASASHESWCRTMYVNARAVIERETPDGLEIVIQTRNKPYEEQQLELPGGQVEEFESLVQALRREVKEETGLTVTHIEGLNTLVETKDQGTRVECIRPFAVYQTVKGPVDSMGVYFRCQAEGELLSQGDGTKNPHWTPVAQVKAWIDADARKFSWVDRAGLLFYLGVVDHADYRREARAR